MFLLNWYKQWLEIRVESKEKQILLKQENNICNSCETLKQQLEIVNYEKRQLINRILEKPESEPEREFAPIPKELPKVVPWHIRRQMLEAEDRKKAELLRKAPKSDTEIKTDVEQLEREMDIATAIREAESTRTK